MKFLEIQIDPSNMSNARTTVGDAMTDSPTISGIDFKKGEAGQGRIIVQLSKPDVSVNMSNENSNVILEFLDIRLPEKLKRKFEPIRKRGTL